MGERDTAVKDLDLFLATSRLLDSNVLAIDSTLGDLYLYRYKFLYDTSTRGHTCSYCRKCFEFHKRYLVKEIAALQTLRTNLETVLNSQVFDIGHEKIVARATSILVTVIQIQENLHQLHQLHQLHPRFSQPIEGSRS